MKVTKNQVLKLGPVKLAGRSANEGHKKPSVKTWYCLNLAGRLMKVIKNQVLKLGLVQLTGRSAN